MESVLVCYLMLVKVLPWDLPAHSYRIWQDLMKQIVAWEDLYRTNAIR